MRLSGILFSIIIIMSCASESYKPKELSEQEMKVMKYEDFYENVLKLEKENNYDSALVIVENNFDQYPEEEFDLMKELEYLYRKTEQYEKSLDLFALGHENGYFFLLHPNLPKCAPYVKYKRFNELVEKDTELRAEAIINAETRYEIVLPENYDPNYTYPLFFILHGGGSSLQKARERWIIPDEIKSNYIIVFMQSYIY